MTVTPAPTDTASLDLAAIEKRVNEAKAGTGYVSTNAAIDDRAALLAALRSEMRELEMVRAEKDGVIRTALHYETALRSIAKNTCCDKCQEAALVALRALGIEP